MSKRLVLFDLDGTLTNPKLGITSGVQHALNKFGIHEPNLTKLESFIGPPLRESFTHEYGFSEEDANKAVTYYREYFDPIGWRQNEVFPGIPDVLSALQDDGYMIGLATSKPTVFAERILTHFGLRDAFSVVIGSNLDGTREDKAEVIGVALAEASVMDGSAAAGTRVGHGAGVALAEAGVSAGRAASFASSTFVVMVGDRKYDIVGGKKWGLRTVGVTYGFGSREELQNAGADDIVDRPLALMDAIASLAK
ncbi:HAD hydrolase-like protein [Alicyclobacillus mengziensis]|uniref:HAD hydrolase-like protein n=1 Tax=Alicyclobacillus mengziensis TaxID=2931921 RepID=A0A9X7VZA0_9BACL|nr:HAD hydrolase-like protein [Alicyclobacillus mengziensis]QSO47602.1 HAD hydrolase-like protein [Alicyclobacillus mengziensis]